MDLCASCGVVRIDGQAACAHCRAQHESQRLTTPRGEGSFWVSVECAFTCRMCAFSVPLNHLDMDGAVLCARCGLEQAFDVRAWVDALQYAHAVGELFGPPAEGIDAEVATIGVRRTSAEHTIASQNALKVTVSPGHPLCPKCHGLADVALGEAGAATVACKACDATASYVLPAAAQRMMKSALRAVIADEHRSDRAAVRVKSTASAVAIECPSCNAALPASSETKFIKCTYCNTTSRIPDHQWFKISGKDPVFESIWLLFEGTSRLHKDFDRRKAKADAQDRGRVEKEQKRVAHEQKVRDDKAARAREADDARKRDDAAAARKREAESAEEAAEKRSEDKEQRRGTLLFFGIPLTLLAIACVVIYFLDIK
jgi:hypothetical protein